MMNKAIGIHFHYLYIKLPLMFKAFDKIVNFLKLFALIIKSVTKYLDA